MEIGPLHNDKPVQSAGGNRQKSAGEIPRIAPKKDSVEISGEARKRLAELADRYWKEAGLSSGPGAGDRCASERVTRARTRIESGYYEDPEVKEKIADRLIEGIRKDYDEPNENEE